MLSGLLENKTKAVVKGIVNVIDEENKLVGRFGVEPEKGLMNGLGNVGGKLTGALGSIGGLFGGSKKEKTEEKEQKIFHKNHFAIKIFKRVGKEKAEFNIGDGNFARFF